MLRLAYSIVFVSLFLVLPACEQSAVEMEQPENVEQAPLAVEGVVSATTEDGSSTFVDLKLKDAWPLFRGDPAATGVARSELPADPKLLWTFSTDEGGFEATAAIADGMVYVGSTDGRLYAIHLDSGTKAWEYPTDLGFITAPGIYGGRVYIGDDDGRFHCLDAKTGKLIWHHDAEAEINSAANFHRGNVLFGSQDSILYCLDAKTGNTIWKFQCADQIRCTASIVDDRAFVAGCDGELHVVDLNKGKQIEAVPLDSPTGCTPSLAAPGKTPDGKSLPGMAYVGTEGGVLLAIDWQSGRVAWTYSNPEKTLSIRSSAAITDKAVLVGARDKTLHAIDRTTGEPLWEFPTRGRIDGSPVVVGKRVFVGSADGRLYGVDLATGKQSWQYETGGSITASPAVAAGRLVIGTDDGDFFCFGKKSP